MSPSAPPIVEQAELNLRMKAARGVNRDSVEEFCQLLRGREWMTAAAIEALRPEWRRSDHRFVRLLANAAGERVISYPGSPGYRLAAEISVEEAAEIQRAGNVMIHQGRDMARQGIRYHRLAGKLLAAAAQLHPA